MTKAKWVTFDADLNVRFPRKIVGRLVECRVPAKDGERVIWRYHRANEDGDLEPTNNYYPDLTVAGIGVEAMLLAEDQPLLGQAHQYA